MAGRVSYGTALGLDIRNADKKETGVKEFPHIDDLGKEEWESLDLFLGVTGVSVLKQDFFEKLILEGSARDLFFASGSTKTVEFESLTAWIEELSNADRPTIGGHGVRIERRPIKDPQNQILQGHHVRIVFEKQPGDVKNFPFSHKDLYLLGDSMPINFLYYGVPGEVIDGVFEELLSVLFGFVSRHKEGHSYGPGIYAVDVNIDKHGDPCGKDSGIVL